MRALTGTRVTELQAPNRKHLVTSPSAELRPSSFVLVLVLERGTEKTRTKDEDEEDEFNRLLHGGGGPKFLEQAIDFDVALDERLDPIIFSTSPGSVFTVIE